MDTNEYHQIEAVEQTHFWYRAMEQLTLDWIERQWSPRNYQILDIGCGPGGMTKKLVRFGSVVGLDIHPLALKLAAAKEITVLQGDVCCLPLRQNFFDLVTVFDVLYNQSVADDDLVFHDIWRVLKPGGNLFLREPALEIFRGDHDLVVRTRKRYRAAEIRQKLLKCGFNIQKITYANMVLGIPLLFRRIFQRMKRQDAVRSDTFLLSKTLNQLFYNLLRAENAWLKFSSLPFGSSVICIANKPLAGER